MAEPVTLYVATKNAGKMHEFARMFPADRWRLETYAEYPDVEEGEASYAENAMLKAVALRRQLDAAGIGAAVLGDDSGIEVAALGGAPGVLSARFGGPDATWPQRCTLLLERLRGVSGTDRAARFVCALYYLPAHGAPIALERDVHGFVAEAAFGGGGFGYDPIFTYPPAAVTFAEMTEDEKHRVSHRGRAVAALLAALERAEFESSPGKRIRGSGM